MIPGGRELDPDLIERLAALVRALDDEDTWSEPPETGTLRLVGRDDQPTRDVVAGTVARVWIRARDAGLVRDGASSVVLDHVILQAREPLLPVNRELIALALEAIADRAREI